MENLTREEQEKLERLLSSELSQKPPTIGLIGVSGVGKSSTINSLFKTELPISHTVACTKEFEEIELGLKAKQGVLEGKNIQLIVFDAPGLGEDINKDPDYIKMYNENLPKCDVILWVLSARNRAIALDQQYLTIFKKFHERIIFGLNQVDLVEPMNWNPNLPIPSEIQRKYIDEIIKDRKTKLSSIIGKDVVVIPYSNYKKYNLEVLFTSILETCQSSRKWLFYSLKGFRFDELEEIKQKISKNHSEIPKQEKVRKPNFFSSFSNLFKPKELPQNAKNKIQDLLNIEDVSSHKLSEDELLKVKDLIKKESSIINK
jgi:uncharacterized protein